MADSQEEKSVPVSTELIVAEYTTLRDEILKLTDIQTQFLVITLASFGTVLTIGTQTKNAAPIMFIYPLLVFFIALNWINNAHGIDLLGLYIQEKIELKVGLENIGWENYSRKSPSTYSFIAFWGSRAIFPVTQIIALIAGMAVAKFVLLDITLFTVALISTIWCIVHIVKMSQTHGQGKRLVSKPA